MARCVYCGGTGTMSNGQPCTFCNKVPKGVKLQSISLIPKIYREAAYMPEMCTSEKTLEFLNLYSRSTNYIIKGPNNTGKITLALTVLNKLLLNGEIVLPILLPLHLNGIISAIQYNKEYKYSDEISLSVDNIRNSSILIVRINTLMDNSSLNSLRRLIEYREINSRGIVITTQLSLKELGLGELQNSIVVDITGGDSNG